MKGNSKDRRSHRRLVAQRLQGIYTVHFYSGTGIGFIKPIEKQQPSGVS
jgi:hypothetical protein